MQTVPVVQRDPEHIRGEWGPSRLGLRMIEHDDGRPGADVHVEGQPDASSILRRQMERPHRYRNHRILSLSPLHQQPARAVRLGDGLLAVLLDPRLDHRASLDLPSSEATSALRSALELVRGKPYTAKAGYSWAYDEHAASRAVQVVGDVASRLVDLCGEAGDLPGARATIERASRAIDDPMAEVGLRLAESRLSDLPQFVGLRESARAFEVRLASYLDEHDPAAEVGGG